MMKKIYSVVIALVGLLSSLCVEAQIHVPDIFSDNCVLQHNSKANIWGTAAKNVAVTVKGSWNDEAVTVQSDADGKWRAQLDTPDPSNKTYTITISQPDDWAYTIHNVAIGDVWICSGQSNMEMPVQGWLPEYPINNSASLIQQAGKWPNIRCAMVKVEQSNHLRDECHGTWKVSSPENTPVFSAAAYCFAMYQANRLHHPIGILVTTWGATKIEPWLPERYMKKYGDTGSVPQDKWQRNTPCLLYNAMVYPLKGYTCAGFIWYQGESNVGDTRYCDKMKDLIKCWREDWGQGDLPFYFVEIAPWNYRSSNDGTNAARLREQQLKAALETPNSGLVSTNDLISGTEATHNIHPGNKMEIGYRLSGFAMSSVLKKDPWGPVYKSMRTVGNKAVISFTHNDKGFINNPNITGFEVAGADKVFHPAFAEIVNEHEVQVYSPEVTKVAAVRYCFGDAILGNLINKENLPAYPFRTDNW